MNKDFLRKRRIEVGLSQEFIADSLGYSTQTISLWESGKASPSLIVWSKYASLLKIDLEGLILDKNKKENDYSDSLSFDSNKFASELRRLRKNKGITQLDLAKNFNINVGLIIKFEKGKSFPNVKQFIALCVYYKLSFDELYFSISVNKVVEKETPKKKRIPIPILVPIIITLAGGTTATSVAVISREILSRRSEPSFKADDEGDDVGLIDDGNGGEPKDNEPADNNHQEIVLEEDEIKFGSYPQSHVSDAQLISNLELLTPNEQNYYEYEDNLYEKCQADYDYPPTNDNYFDDNTKVIDDEYYWFKVEPIVWKVIEDNEDNYIVISKNIIDAKTFDDGDGNYSPSNNYKNSTTRKWLNDDFINKAFKDNKTQLIEVEVDNSIACTSDEENYNLCGNTNDYAFLPSKIELQKYLGCSLPYPYPIPDTVTRDLVSKTSEYCRCKDTPTDENNNGSYWLRAPDRYSTEHTHSVVVGEYSIQNNVRSCLGIRPIIKIHK